MPVETPSFFAAVIQEHLELKRKNAPLDGDMPLNKYRSADDPFENHAAFKTEEQARVEDTMDGVKPIDEHETALDWPAHEGAFPDIDDAPPELVVPELDGDATQETVLPVAEAEAGEEQSDENLWTRSRDFDWGD